MGNMEGKEVRFGVAASSLFAALTTAISCGAVNAMHDSFSALGGMTPLLNMLLGEVVFGGIGAGFYGMMLFVILAIFMSGLMIGRTPEYLGKKIEVKEMQLTVLGILITPSAILALSALAIALPAGRLGILNPGPHGFSEVFYAYTSAAANNGSAFAGLLANTPFYNITLGLGMFLGRFLMIVPVLALTGQLVQKNRTEPSSGSLSTKGLLFVLFLFAVVLIVAGLTFFPVLALGPLAEYFSS
jgi:K+-transporting ATPase ATPase A chain